MAKKVLRGLKRINIFPITANTATEYTTGAAVSVPGAQSLTVEPETSDWKIYADDTVYESGSDWLGMKLTLQLAELPLSLRPHFEGGNWDNATKEYTYKSSSVAPEIGMSFMCATSDQQFRMMKFYALRATKVKGDYKTKGDGDSASPVTIEATVTSRLKDEQVQTMKDTTSDKDFTWMNTLVTAPAVVPGDAG